MENVATAIVIMSIFPEMPFQALERDGISAKGFIGASGLYWAVFISCKSCILR